MGCTRAQQSFGGVRSNCSGKLTIAHPVVSLLWYEAPGVVYGIAAGGCSQEIQCKRPCTVCNGYGRRRNLYHARFSVLPTATSVRSVKPLPRLKAGNPDQAYGMMGMGLGKEIVDAASGRHKMAGVFVDSSPTPGQLVLARADAEGVSKDYGKDGLG